MINLECGGYGHQYEEAEVDHRVHDSGDGITHECLHVQAGPHVGQALFDVLLGCLAVLGSAALPVLDPERQLEADIDQQRGDQGIEHGLHRRGNISKHLAGLGPLFMVKFEDRGGDA